MDTVHRGPRRWLSAGLTLAFLLAAAGPPAAPTTSVQATITHRSVFHGAVAFGHTTSLRPGALSALPSIDTGELPDERDQTNRPPVPARAERVTTSRDARRPAPPFVGGDPQHLRI